MNLDELKNAKEALDTVFVKVQSMKKLPVVKFDDNAIKAVRENNTKVVDAAEDQPLKGGNIEAYTALGAQSEPMKPFEETVFNWHIDGTPMHLVAYQLVLFYKDKKQESRTSQQSAPDKRESLRMSMQNADAHPLMVSDLKGFA